VGVTGTFALFGASLALGTPAAPSCTQEHRCHHVLHVGTSTSTSAHAAWDSKELFPAGPVVVGINYSPKLPNDAGVRIDPIAECGIHFVLPARFTGVATRCGSGLQPLHVQVANVNRRHLRVGVTYWVPAPLFTG
jgi:hypothetical protein